jgi:hypothetical protein
LYSKPSGRNSETLLYAAGALSNAHSIRWPHQRATGTKVERAVSYSRASAAIWRRLCPSRAAAPGFTARVVRVLTSTKQTISPSHAIRSISPRPPGDRKFRSEVPLGSSAPPACSLAVRVETKLPRPRFDDAPQAFSAGKVRSGRRSRKRSTARVAGPGRRRRRRRGREGTKRSPCQLYSPQTVLASNPKRDGIRRTN